MSKKSASKILVVDDAAFMRALLKSILEEGGFSRIYEAKDGEEAIEHFKKHRPDLVTMDVIMPGMGGMATLKEILKIEPKANVVMISSVGQEKTVEEAMKIGAKGYVAKPVESKAVLNIVGKLLL